MQRVAGTYLSPSQTRLSLPLRRSRRPRCSASAAARARRSASTCAMASAPSTLRQAPRLRPSMLVRTGSGEPQDMLAGFVGELKGPSRN